MNNICFYFYIMCACGVFVFYLHSVCLCDVYVGVLGVCV